MPPGWEDERARQIHCQYWLVRADQARRSRGMKDPDAKRTMEEIAAGYRYLAERAEEAHRTPDSK
jgi:hypothetical protein